MSNIASVFSGSRSAGPYDKGVRAQVIDTAQPVTYRGKDGKQKEALSAVIGDGAEIVKVTCYDVSKFRFFQVGKTIMMKNIIKKTDDGRCVVVTTPSKVAFCAPLGCVITEKHREEAKAILNPPPAQLAPIAVALASPKKQKNTIRGRLVQIDETRTVKANGEDVDIKTITVEDNTSRCKVTLWRKCASLSCSTGSFVEITDVQVNNYQDTVSLSTTIRSEVTPIDTLQTVEKLTVYGITVTDGNAELFIQQDDESDESFEMIVPAELVHQAVGGEEDLETVCETGPLKLSVTRKGSEILCIERC